MQKIVSGFLAILFLFFTIGSSVAFAAPLTYQFRVTSCLETSTGVNVKLNGRQITMQNSCTSGNTYHYSCIDSTNVRVNRTDGCVATQNPPSNTTPTTTTTAPTPTPASTPTTQTVSYALPAPVGYQLSGSSQLVDSIGMHVRGAWKSNTQLRMDFDPAVNSTGYEYLEFDVNTHKLSATSFSDASLKLYIYSEWNKSSAQVPLSLDILNGTTQHVKIRLSDLTSTIYDPSRMAFMFIHMTAPTGGAVDMDMQVSNMKLTKTVTVGGSTGGSSQGGGDGGSTTGTPTTPPPTQTPPPAPVSGTTMTIDTNGTLIPYVDRGVLGGNSMNDRAWDYNFNIFTELGGSARPSGNNLNRPLWRMHMWDTGYSKNYWMYGGGFGRMTDGLYNPMIPQTINGQTVSIYSWQLQKPMKDMQVQYATGEASQNYYEVEWFDRSPTFADKFNRHAISYTKKPGSTTQTHIIANREQTGVTTFPEHNRYTRFDFKLSSEVPYVVNSAALIGRSKQFELLLRPDKKFEVRIGNQSIVSPQALAFDTWYGIEILTDNTSKVWLNGTLMGEVTLPTLDTTTSGRSTEVRFGTLLRDWTQDPALNAETQKQDSYKFKIDEIMLGTAYFGTNPSAPLDQSYAAKYTSNVIVWHSFDNNIMTLDDYGQMAEKMNAELLLQLPSPKETTYGSGTDTWTGFFKNLYSVEGLTAMIEYMVGTPDADYNQKVEQMKQAGWPFNVAQYNYANLRASRGRVAPYDIRYVELGNEPYYQEYTNNEQGFADRFIDTCESIQRVKSDLKCILPAQYSSQFNFEKVLQRITSRGKGHLVGGLATHNYYDYYNQDRVNQYPLSTMAGPYWEAQTRFATNKSLAERYLPGQTLLYVTDEYNSILNDFKNKQTDKFLDAVYSWSEIAFMLEKGIQGGSLFFWNSATMGEGFVNGLVGDYNWKPEQTLNGDVFQAFARYFGWGGKMLPVSYNNYMGNDAVTTKKAPKVTAISSLSADGRKLFVAVANRDTAVHEYTLQLNGFVPKAQATQYQMDASSLTQTHRDLNFVQTQVSTSNLNYSFPGYSMTFMVFERN